MSVELRGRGEIPVACGECGFDHGGRMTLVDRWVTDYPPIPYTGPIVEVYLDTYGDPDDHVHECPECQVYLDEHTCVERSNTCTA